MHKLNEALYTRLKIEGSEVQINTKQIDERGAIFSVMFAGKESGIIFETSAGTARGGETSTCDKHITLLRGKVFWVFIKDGKEVIQEHKLYQDMQVPKLLPHLFVAVQPSLLMRWFESDGSWDNLNSYHPELREYVTNEQKRQELLQRYEALAIPGIRR